MSQYAMTVLFLGGTFLFLILMLLAMVAIVFRYWVSATPDTSIYRTGTGGAQVTCNGGTLVIPRFHEMVRVCHSIFYFDINGYDQPIRTADDDSVRSHVRCYVYVKKDPTDIQAVATHLQSHPNQDRLAADIFGPEFMRITRAAAKGLNKSEIMRNPDAFATAVKNAIIDSDECPMLGYTLHSIELVMPS